MPFDQSKRIAGISTPLGDNVLALRGFTMTEALGRLPTWEVDLISEKGDIEPKQLLGQAVTVRLNQKDDGKRFFHGHVIQFGRGPKEEQHFAYRATVAPWFWFLTRTSNCRVFQKKSVPQIFQEVCKAHGFSDFEPRLKEPHGEWEYCVQYRETDFNFLSRLMEQEGIYYFFRHEEGRHMLVLCDSPSSHEPFPGYGEISYRESVAHGEQEQREHIREFTPQMNHVSSKYVHNDYNMETPRVPLDTNSSAESKHVNSGWEVYDYPGEYETPRDGSEWAKVRMQEIDAQREIASGWTDARGLGAGHTFSYVEPHNPKDKGDYLITSVKHVMQTNEYQTDRRGAAEWVYGCQFVVQPSSRVFRPARVTPKPLVHGIQTAVVVGPAGEEIYTDKYGRIKVQFFWDREGRKNENSSCFVRVAQAWAGQQWGAIHIPRIGHEVVVAFLEGDPDQPLVIGSVYNADNMPPYVLPDNKTQSGVKSRSSRQGGPHNFNEIRFEDKKGSEQVYIHAEKNQDIEVENDETHWVGHDRKKTVDNDEETIVGGNRTETVGRSEKITIGMNRTEIVGQSQSVTIAMDDTLLVGKSKTDTITMDHTKTVGMSETHTVGMSNVLNVGVNYVINTGAALTINAGGAVIINAAAITLNAPVVSIAGRPVRPAPPPTPIP